MYTFYMKKRYMYSDKKMDILVNFLNKDISFHLFTVDFLWYFLTSFKSHRCFIQTSVSKIKSINQLLVCPTIYLKVKHNLTNLFYMYICFKNIQNNKKTNKTIFHSLLYPDLFLSNFSLFCSHKY